MGNGAEHERHLLGIREVLGSGGSLVYHQEVVSPHVALRVPLRFLLAADQGEHLGEQLRDNAQFQREGEPDRRSRRLEAQLLDLAPDPLCG